MPKSRLTSIQTLLDQKNDDEVRRREEESMAKREPALCVWCPAEAEAGIEVAGQPVCEVHRHEIEAEVKVNAGRTLTPTRAERTARQEGFRRLMDVEADWQQRQRWVGR
jgi:hypothetical protein